MSSFAWLSDLMTWLGTLVPRLAIVAPNFKVVAFVRAKNIRVWSPGIYVYWPIVTDLHWVPIARQIVTTTNQVLDMVDGKTIVCSAQVTFRVVDPVKFAVENVDPEESIIEAALAAIRCTIVDWDYDHLLLSKQEFNNELLSEMRARLNGFGVEVENTAICDLAKTKVFCILNNQPSDKAFTFSPGASQ